MFFDVFENSSVPTSPTEHPQVLAHRRLGDPELVRYLNLAEAMTLDEFPD
ncbi:unnamed protein product [marine sediment metagenome]|uniref:Uncharacterized protein n=1 Tax=marine sediment metagenome TaxID=412755 RepID=X1NDB6_9ZZZZ